MKELLRLNERGHQVSTFHTMKELLRLDERGHQVSPFHTMKELLMFTLLKHIRASASIRLSVSEKFITYIQEFDWVHAWEDLDL